MSASCLPFLLVLLLVSPLPSNEQKKIICIWFGNANINNSIVFTPFDLSARHNDKPKKNNLYTLIHILHTQLRIGIELIGNFIMDHKQWINVEINNYNSCKKQRKKTTTSESSKARRVCMKKANFMRFSISTCDCAFRYWFNFWKDVYWKLMETKYVYL